MRNITVHQSDGNHQTDRCAYGPIQLHDSFLLLGADMRTIRISMGHGTLLPPQSTLNLLRECGHGIMNPLDEFAMG